MAAKKAAIDPDLLDRPLGQIDAAAFVGALREARLEPAEMAVLADKKKYELWTDETPVAKISIGELIERIRGEKKKLELEKRRWEMSKREVELEIGPTTVLGDPAVRDALVDEIATEVVRRMGR